MARDQENYGSEFLYAEDLLYQGAYHTVTVTIAEVFPPNTLRTKAKKLIDKYTLRFEGKTKMLVLCNTNRSMIKFVTGNEIDHSVGQQITLQPRIVDAFGEKCVAIRVLPQPGVPVRRAVAQRLGEKAVYTPTKTPAKPKAEAEQKQLMDTSANTGE